jgi:hypothetical protein
MDSHIDLSNRTFGLLFVKEKAYDEDKFHPKRIWKCICRCGKECFYSTYDIVRKNKEDCGCGRNHLVMGEIYNNTLELLERLPGERNKEGYLVRAKCLICNKEFTKRSRLLYDCKSCGCLSTQQGPEKMPPGEASCRTAIRNYQRYAAKRCQEFALTNEQFRYITKQNCYYCNKEPAQRLRMSKNGFYIYNGIDRLNNNIGYVYENCVPCCHQCNRMKSTLTEDEFIDHLRKIINHRENMNAKN